MIYDNPARAAAFLNGPFEGLCTPTEMAEYLHIDDSTIRQAIRSGRLTVGEHCIQLGKQWVLSRYAWDIMARYGGYQELSMLEAKCRKTIASKNDTVS